MFFLFPVAPTKPSLSPSSREHRPAPLDPNQPDEPTPYLHHEPSTHAHGPRPAEPRRHHLHAIPGQPRRDSASSATTQPRAQPAPLRSGVPGHLRSASGGYSSSSLQPRPSTTSGSAADTTRTSLTTASLRLQLPPPFPTATSPSAQPAHRASIASPLAGADDRLPTSPTPPPRSRSPPSSPANLDSAHLLLLLRRPSTNSSTHILLPRCHASSPSLHRRPSPHLRVPLVITGQQTSDLNLRPPSSTSSSLRLLLNVKLLLRPVPTPTNLQHEPLPSLDESPIATPPHHLL